MLGETIPSRALRMRATQWLTGVVAILLLSVQSATATAPALTPPSAAAPASAPRTVSISASGDLLAHNSLYLKARTASGSFDFSGQLTPLSRLLTADVDICHLETPLYAGVPSSYPRFGTPISLADEIAAAGWEGCSVASNHSLDKGTEGVATTYQELRRRGIQTSGSRPSAGTSPTAWFTTASGVRVAHLSYTYGFNGLMLPADQPKLVNRIDERSILSAARWARSRGADLVVISLHWGTEYASRPNASQLRLAKVLTASADVDAIIGHHSHVLQPAALVNGKPVLYGLGNLWSGQGPWANQPYGQQGALVRLNFEITEQGAQFTSGWYRPTLTIPGKWKVKSALRVTELTQRTQACRAIEVAAERLGSVLSGPQECPSS